MVNGFFNVTSFSHLTMVNSSLVCCIGNSSRMKARFSIVKPSQKAWFIVHLSKLWLFTVGDILSWILRSILWLCWICAHPLYTCAFDLLHVQSDYQSSGFLRLWNILCHVRELFAQFSVNNFHFFILKYNYNFVNNRNESAYSEIDECI